MNYLPLLYFGILSIWLSKIDVKSHRLPNKLNVVTLIGSLFFIMFFNSDRIIDSVKFGAIYFIIFWLFNFVSKNSIGFGDVKYSTSCGLIIGCYLPSQWILTIWLMFALSAVTSLLRIALGRLKITERIAFGPYMAIATISMALNSLSTLGT